MVGAVRASPLPARADTEGGGGGGASFGGGSRLLTGPSAAFPRSCAVRGAGSHRGGRPRAAFPGAAAADGGRPSLGVRSGRAPGGLGPNREGKGRGKSPPASWSLLRGGLGGDAAGVRGPSGSSARDPQFCQEISLRVPVPSVPKGQTLLESPL